MILLTVINMLKLQRKVLIEAFNRTVAAFHDAKSVDKVKKETHTGKFCLFVGCFTSHLTAMVMGGRSVHRTTIFPGQA